MTGRKDDLFGDLKKIAKRYFEICKLYEHLI